MKQFYLKNKDNKWFWAFVVLAVSFLFILPLMSLDAGNSGDEDKFQIPQGEYVLDYYRTGGEDTTCLSFENLKYYGSSFDVITAFVNKVFNVDNIHTTRHIFNSFLGWLAILFVGLIACKIAGWRAGVLAMLLLFASPRFIGHSFNNCKDIPFATAVIAAIFFMILFFQEFPKVQKKTYVFLILSIAFSISIRIGGLILFGFFGLFGLIYLINIAIKQKNDLKAKPKQKNANKKTHTQSPSLIPFKTVKRLLFQGLFICTAGYFLGLLLWPFALQAPIQNPLLAFQEMSHFTVSLRQLFEGSLQWSDQLPWYYTPKYILMTIPIAVMIGVILYLFVGGCKKENRFTTLILYFSFIFPVFWIVYSNANVYGGWRHAIFAYPPMVVAAGLGFNALIEFLKNKYLKIAAIVLPFLLLIMPLVHIIKNHPYQYVYFNKLAGGIDKAYGNYELDYYYHSTRKATEWVIANAEKTGLKTSDKIIVSSWHPPSVGYFLRKDTAKFQNGFLRWYERSNYDWDYAIFVITGIAPEHIKSKHFPPKNTVHTINVDGKPICIILKREDKSDWKGCQFKSENQIDSAVYYFNKALKLDAYDEVVMINLMEIYFQTGNLDSVKLYIDSVLDFLPQHETVNFYLAHYYLATNNNDDALTVLQRIIKINFKNGQAYRLASNIYLQRSDLHSAAKMLEKLIDIDQLDNQSVKQLVEIYKSQGLNNDAAAYKKLYTVIANSLEMRGKTKEAKEYREEIQKKF